MPFLIGFICSEVSHHLTYNQKLHTCKGGNRRNSNPCGIPSPVAVWLRTKSFTITVAVACFQTVAESLSALLRSSADKGTIINERDEPPVFYTGWPSMDIQSRILYIGQWYNQEMKPHYLRVWYYNPVIYYDPSVYKAIGNYCGT